MDAMVHKNLHPLLSVREEVEVDLKIAKQEHLIHKYFKLIKN